MKQRKQTTTTLPKDFSTMGLKKTVLSALSLTKYKKPTEVQAEVIPFILQGKNTIFTSPTGSGKTLAYTVGSIGFLNAKQGLQMLVVVPTRELAEQVGKEMQVIATPMGLKVGVLYGGKATKNDMRILQRKNQIIVGTPGRLLEHINAKTVRVGEVKYLVFDESDQMFDNGFFGDCVYITKRVGVNVQIVFSSATMTDDVVNFVEDHIKYYEFVEPGNTIPTTILQEEKYLPIPEKNDFLKDFFKGLSFKRAIIFCNTKKRVDEITDFLNENNFRARELHSDLEQKERNANLSFLKKGRSSILVATDVAARGLHIENVDIIINYDIPTRKEFYVHRIGRAGRNGVPGYALNLICPEDEDRFEVIVETYALEVDDYDEASFIDWMKK